MSDLDTQYESVKRNLIRLHAFNIVLLQDSEISKEFFSLFINWEPEQKLNQSQKRSDLLDLCNRLYQKYSQPSDSVFSVSDIVDTVWENQSIISDGSHEIADLTELNSLRLETDSKTFQGNTEDKLENGQVLIGSHPKWKEVLKFSKRVARSNFSVMICGETGVGKELIANHVHENSRRSQNRFVVLNCAAFSEGLIESELFGYEANSFTGADPKGKVGWIGSADGGTLVLDEVADLSTRAQATLLRAIESGELQKVGGKITKVDFRLISISNKPLDELVRGGKFRQDLYYRLSIVPLYIPPLRERVIDIMPLARHFIKKFRQSNPELTAERFSSEAVICLENHHWSGNVRELENVVARAMILCEQVEINSDHLVFDKPQNLNTYVDNKHLIDQLSGISQAGITRLPRGELANFLSTSNWFRSSEYARHFKISESTSHRHLSALCKAGILNKTDKTRNRSYCLKDNQN